MDVETRTGLGRCAVATFDLGPGDSILVERAALFWESGPDELVAIMKAYVEAPESQRKRIDNLTADIQVHSKELDDLQSTWRSIVRKAKKEEHTLHGCEEDDLLSLITRAHFNAHAVQNPPGAALFPAGAMINHSCSPNSFYLCEGHDINFRAAKGLAQKTEITAAYLDAITMLRPTRQRQEALLLSKGFLCSCERCSSIEADITRGVKCMVDACEGVAYPPNSGLNHAQAPTWLCSTCGSRISSEHAIELESTEEELLLGWKGRDASLAEGKPVAPMEIDEAIKIIETQLHHSHYLAQFERVLAVEIGATSAKESLQLRAHAFVLANWLYVKFHRTVPYNMLGIMTGALAALFDRRTLSILPGLDIDRVLTIMKAVLPYAKLRYGEGAPYPEALSRVIDKYSQCSSLICSNKGKLARCGRCNSASYCSRSCQILHFKTQGHKTLCATIVASRNTLVDMIAVEY